MPLLSLRRSHQQDKCLNFRFNLLFIDYLFQRPSHSTHVNSEASLNPWGPQTTELEDNSNVLTQNNLFHQKKKKKSRWWEHHTKMPASRPAPSTHLPGKSQRIEQWKDGCPCCSTSASDHLKRSVWIKWHNRRRPWCRNERKCWRLLGGCLLDICWSAVKTRRPTLRKRWCGLIKWTAARERCESSENTVWLGIGP